MEDAGDPGDVIGRSAKWLQWRPNLVVNLSPASLPLPTVDRRMCVGDMKRGGVVLNLLTAISPVVWADIGLSAGKDQQVERLLPVISSMTTMSILQTVSVGRRRFSAEFQLVFRLIKGLISIVIISIMIILIVISHLTVQDMFVCILAFVPTGWGLLLVAQAIKPVVVCTGFWGSIMAIARGYDKIMGLLLFSPIAFLAWFPFVSEFQTRMLFNQAYSRGLQMSRVLGGQMKDPQAREKQY